MAIDNLNRLRGSALKPESRLRGSALRPVTRTVDDFFIHASSKLGKEELGNMPILREAFDATGLKDLFVGFEGRRSIYRGSAQFSVPFDMGKTIGAKDVGRKTIAAVLDEETFIKLYGDGYTEDVLGFFQDNTEEAKNILKGVGIEYGKDVTGVVAINPNQLKSQKGKFYNPNQALLTTTHEYGHGASIMSGAYESDKVLQQFDKVFNQFENDYFEVKEYRSGIRSLEDLSSSARDIIQSRFR